MLKSNERICACGCGQIINIKCSSYILKENLHRNSYYANKHHLPFKYQGIEDWCLEKGYLKGVKQEEKNQ